MGSDLPRRVSLTSDTFEIGTGISQTVHKGCDKAKLDYNWTTLLAVAMRVLRVEGDREDWRQLHPPIDHAQA